MQSNDHQPSALQEVYNQVISKCWEDESFKQALIADPVATIERFTGRQVSLPEGTQLVVNDQTDARFAHINIPPQPNMEDVELTEDQLDVVAGGVIGDGCTKPIDLLNKMPQGFTIA